MYSEVQGWETPNEKEKGSDESDSQMLSLEEVECFSPDSDAVCIWLDIQIDFFLG